MFAALATLLPLLALTTASPVHKRFTGALIYSGRDGKCLSTVGAVGDGTPVQSVDCGGADVSRWNINPGSGSVTLTNNPGFALDAGIGPHNNGALKVWTSYPGLFQQTWYLTGDNRIAITGGDQCLDEGDNGIQTYQCTTGNTNQIFYIRDGGAPPSSSSSASSGPSPTSSAGPTPTGVRPDIPSGSAFPDPPVGNGRRLHPYGRPDLCATVQNGYAGDGTAVDISYCVDNASEFAKFQLWDAANGATGLIRLHGTNFCLDGGIDPHDGVDMKIWTCYDGLYQQTFEYTNDNRLKLANNQCLDMRAGSNGNPNVKPYGSVADLQTWTCYAGNTNQDFFEIPY